MRRVKSSEAREHMRDLLNQAEHGEHIEICRYDTPTAVLVPWAWYQRVVESGQFGDPRTWVPPEGWQDNEPQA